MIAVFAAGRPLPQWKNSRFNGESELDFNNHPQFGVAMARMVHCIKLGREAEGLDLPPLPGELGKRIYESVSKEGWQQWQKQQTMLINENRLSLADPRARKYLLEQTERFFFGAGADAASGYVPPKS
jgi:Fe-S cluster biosynthesis and repair protein YggX